jgi:hypothetical protein
MLLTLHMCDNLFNAMINPIFIICAGGLTGLNFKFASPAEFVRNRTMKTPQPRALPVGSSRATA